jgi:hypothetical protein
MPLPVLLFPPLQSSMGCWNQTTQDVATSTIQHGGDPWQSRSERQIEVLGPIIQKQSSLKLHELTHKFCLGVINDMRHSMSELRFEPLQYADIGNICVGWYYACRQEDGRDLATFGINAVCFLFFAALTPFTIYPSHSVGMEWGYNCVFMQHVIRP